MSQWEAVSPEVTDTHGGGAPDEIRALGMHGKYRDMITTFTWVFQEVGSRARRTIHVYI